MYCLYCCPKIYSCSSRILLASENSSVFPPVLESPSPSPPPPPFLSLLPPLPSSFLKLPHSLSHPLHFLPELAALFHSLFHLLLPSHCPPCLRHFRRRLFFGKAEDGERQAGEKPAMARVVAGAGQALQQRGELGARVDLRGRGGAVVGFFCPFLFGKLCKTLSLSKTLTCP